MSSGWWTLGSCYYDDPELFFPDSYVSARGLIQVEEARSVCRGCPVINTCREEALDAEGGRKPEGRHGIRAALTPTERYNLGRKRPRPRVPKLVPKGTQHGGKNAIERYGCRCDTCSAAAAELAAAA